MPAKHDNRNCENKLNSSPECTKCLTKCYEKHEDSKEKTVMNKPFDETIKSFSFAGNEFAKDEKWENSQTMARTRKIIDHHSAPI